MKKLGFVFIFIFFVTLCEPAQAKAYAFDNGSGPGIEKAPIEEVKTNPAITTVQSKEIQENLEIEFKDITPESEVYKSLVNLRRKGFILPWDGDEQLQPDKIVKKTELAQTLYSNYKNKIPTKKGVGHFLDLIDVSNSADYTESIQWSLEGGILESGYVSESDNIYFSKNDTVGYYFYPESERSNLCLFTALYSIAKNGGIKLPETHKSFISIEEEQYFIDKGSPTYEPILPLERAGVIRQLEDGSTGLLNQLSRENLIIYLDRFSDISGLGK